MLFATMGQGRLFIWMMAAGAVIGAWYVLTALLRRILQAGFLLTLACDLLFGAGAAIIFIAAHIIGNYGAVRPYTLLATICGAAAFLFACTPPLKALQKRLQRVGRTIVAAVSRNRLIKVIFR